MIIENVNEWQQAQQISRAATWRI